MTPVRRALRAVEAWRWSLLAATCCTAFLAASVRVGADWNWVVAMGDVIRRTGTVPDHVPFAAAPSEGWHDVPVLAQLVGSFLDHSGPGGVVLAHLALAALAWAALLQCARSHGAPDRVAAIALVVVVAGSLPSWGLVRLQSFSLPLFALMLVLVLAQARRPDGRIWLAPPLVALWGNLHGAVLLGVCVLGAYLLLGRLRARPVETVLVGSASLAALLVTPQGLHTVTYYLDVFDNAAAQRGEGLWASPDLSRPFDVAMLLAAALLVGLLVRRRREVWEYVAAGGLVVATLDSARHGVWLLCLLMVLVARRRDVPHGSARPPTAGPLVVLAVTTVAVAVPVVLARGGAVGGVDEEVVRAVAERADDDVVLAPAPLVERLAVAGVTIWAGNPLDAFEHDVQEAYLDFLAGRPGMRAALAGSDVVVTPDGTSLAAAVEAALPEAGDFEAVGCGEGWTCHVRR